MVRWQGRSLKKPSGGRIWARRRKRKRELGREFPEPTIGSRTLAQRRVRGGGKKYICYRVELANVSDPKSGLSKLTRVIKVLENPADAHFVRRDVLTLGALIETELGKAKVTSRPGQDGIVNAVLIEPRKPVEAGKPSDLLTPSPAR